MVKWGDHKYKIFLAVLFLVVFFTRLYFTYQVPEFTYDSYYELRHIEHVENSYFPLYKDDLSYQGRTYYFPPLFLYVMAGAAKIFGISLAGKLIPSLLFSVLIFLVYAIANCITNNRNYSTLAALFYAFTPISYVFPINNVSAYSLALPLFFGVLYAVTKIKDKYVLWMLLLIVALVFAHPSAFLLVIGLVFYLILVKLEGLKTDKKSLEVILFIMFLVFWALFVLYKNLFLMEGLGAIWQNIPAALLSQEFPILNIFEMVYFLGLVPLLLGVITAYKAIFGEANRPLLMLTGFTIAIFALLWAGYIQQEPGLLFLSVLLSILSARSMALRAKFIDKTKFYKLKNYWTAIVVVFFLVTSVAPLYGSAMAATLETPSETSIAGYKWLEDNSKESSTILASLKEGHVLTYYSGRKNVLDSNFLLIEDADERLVDARKAYTSRLNSEAYRILGNYEVDYIFLGESVNESYGVTNLHYLNDACFSKVYDKDVQIYKVECKFMEADS